MVAGVRRSYVVVRPASVDSTHPIPLVIALHGYTLNATWMESNTGFDQEAARAGFVVVYAQGIKNSWNAGTCCGHNTGDDVAFIRMLIDRLVGDDDVDARRVFVTGMSNGAAMAQRVACELADQVTAVASVSGSLLVDSCLPSRPISLLEIHGTDDSVIPFSGGFTAGLGEFPSTMSVMETWERVDGCSDSPVATRSGITAISSWGGCSGGAVVALDAISGGKHVWFGPSYARGEPDATQICWDFFSRVPPLP
jgi:polyhydroxybutyrate depolymerase